jgi:hypothetical protein
VRLSMRSMLLSQSTQAKKHHTEKTRQTFHPVNPPDSKIAGGLPKKRYR